MSDWEDDDAPQSTTIPVNGFSSNNDTNFGSSKGTGFGRGRGFAIDNNESGSRFGFGGGGRGFGGSESDVPRGGGFRSSNRGGGFGSRGGGGGGGRSCYKCGEDGHMSRDCPQGGGGDRKKGCFKCGEEGHMSRDCPSGGGGGFGSSNGGFGSSNSGGGFGSSSGGGFGSSGGGGFKSSSSGGFGGPGGERKKGCFKCGEDGHMSRDCPNSDGGGASGDRKKGCFKCGEDGHMSRDCPSAGDGDDNRKKGCFNCGEEGHFSKDCTNPAQPRTGADGKLREIYVPPDLDEDENVLFHDGITSGINFSKYDHINVSVSGNDIVSHINSFESSNLREILKENVKKCNYLRPTPIQKHALPIIMAGRDVMACAQTGSGKTAAFLLPIIHKLLEMDAESGAYQPTQEPLAVIISPTRELAIQIYQESCKFASRSMIKCVVAYGGTSVMHQTNKLKNGCHILVATPGRLLDFVEKGKVSFSRVQFLVLDEADRMLDMGFMPEIQRMVKNPDMPKKGDRQTLMFSATFPAEIQRLAADFLHDYLFVVVGMVGAASSDVSQSFVQVDKFGKRDRLMEVLGDIGQDQKTLVFVETKRTADFIASYLSQKQLPSTSIHGDRLQREREEALRDFKQGRMPILIATSVAARGLDIRGVSYVVNYDLPKSVDEYVHRIGRTGRVGNIGNAISFYDSSTDTSLAKDLVKILADAQQEVPDFLSQDASQSGYTQTYQGSGNFSSRDARKGQFNGGSSSGGFTSQPTSALEADDEWD